MNGCVFISKEKKHCNIRVNDISLGKVQTHDENNDSLMRPGSPLEHLFSSTTKERNKKFLPDIHLKLWLDYVK